MTNVDGGLGDFLETTAGDMQGHDYSAFAAGTYGAFKVPTLRNLTLTAPYGHNGYFATLKDIVHFYNTRDVPAAKWPAPEVGENVNVTELGHLGLTEAKENDLVAFLKTLTDRVIVPIPVK